MKKIVYVINIMIFLLILFGIGLYNVSVHKTYKGFPSPYKKELRTGEFAEAFDGYFNSSFMFRNELVQLSSDLKSLYGVADSRKAELVTVRSGNLFAVREKSAEPVNDADSAEAADTGSVSEPEKAPGSVSITEDEPETSAKETPQRVVNEVLLLPDRGMEVLQFNRESAAYYADSVNLFAAGLPLDTAVYAVVLPSRLAFADENYRNLGADQRTGIGYMYSCLDERIITIDPFNPLAEHIEEYIYFRTDHHWTALGAYYVYREFAEAAGMEPEPISRYETDTVSGFTGSMYLTTLSKNLRDNPDSITLYQPFVGHTYKVLTGGALREKPILDMSYCTDQNKYQIFVSSDRRLGVIETDLSNDRKLLLFKDSYGNAFIPFLIPHYKEIHIIDPRYYEGNVVEYFDRYDFDDVLFINYFAVVGNVKGYARNLRKTVVSESRGKTGS